MKFYSAEQYQGKCQERFLRYQSEIQELLPDARIEHVGASSIPMAISKGDLDIFVGVEMGDFCLAIQRLMTLGFQEKSDTLRTSELCMLESTSGDDVAFQIVVNGSEFECFLAFRDKLRKDASLVQRYNNLKLSCEGLSQDDYRGKKSEFIEQVLAQA
ncbi:GrpB family protein, partial [Vibrio cholerae]|nr:GrpB family protein [Vibrio cholerae]EGQ9647848.1 GrpB family protein [Vibrio cholerae]EIC2299306.1 GrpB family protein [Vibrio cholerae]EJL6641016.1 GrpB family protein [Vibrio cholerae]EJL6912871.1 GrpB family protein [Vibrio cholerae]